MHGPILVHQKKEFSSYHYFLSTLIGLRPKLSSVQAFGSDGEESLVQALKSSFPWAQQLRCFLRMRINIKAKLADLSFTSTSSLVLADIFGKSDGTNFEGVFFAQLEGIMKNKWNNLEKNEQPKFFNWFLKYESQVFADAMIKPRREAAGLGSPAAEFTTNACESGHAALKNYLPKRNQCSWQEFVQKSLNFVEDQRREIEMAILNRGKYCFKKEYSSLVVGVKWFKLNQAQKNSHLKKVHSQELCYDLGPPEEDGGVHAQENTSDIQPSVHDVSASPSPHISSENVCGTSYCKSNVSITYLEVTSTEFASKVKISRDTGSDLEKGRSFSAKQR